jgi:hypothetical protein
MSLRESILTAICLLERAGVHERRGGVLAWDTARDLPLTGDIECLDLERNPAT